MRGSKRSESLMPKLGAASAAEGGVGGAFEMNIAGTEQTLEIMAVYIVSLERPRRSNDQLLTLEDERHCF